MKKQKEPWEPTSYSKNSNEVTFENGKFLQIKSRSGRWESVAVSPHGRGDVAGSGGTREMAWRIMQYVLDCRRTTIPVETLP